MNLMFMMFKMMFLLLNCILDLILMIFKYLGTHLVSLKKLQVHYLMRNQMAEENSLQNSAAQYIHTSFSLPKICFSLSLNVEERTILGVILLIQFKNKRIV